MSSSSGRGLLVTGLVTAVAATAALLYLLTRPPARTRASVKRNASEGDEPDVLAESDLAVDKKKLLAIFHEITARMQHVVMRLAQEEQRVSQQRASRGQPPNAAEIQRYLIARFQEAMGEIETQVYSKYNTQETEVRKAVKFFEDDEELVKAISTLKALYNAVMGHPQDLPDVPDHLTMEKVLDVLKGTMDVLRTSAETIRNELTKKGFDIKKDPREFSAKFQPLYAATVERERSKLLIESGIEQETILQAAVVKFQNNERFQLELKAMTDLHNEKMAQLGFGLSG